jgi:dipeptidyl aminopeptidase/acylaminoacyl peptidase
VETSGGGATAHARKTVRIRTASGDDIDAWLYLPVGAGPHPAVVMAHGIGAIKAGGLAPFAERFCHAGFAAVVFDYRQWGDSEGQPREELSFPRQLEDYRIMIGWAGAQHAIDERRIFAWGTSFAGMYVVELAATDARLAGAIAQSPLVDGLAAAMLPPPARRLRLLAAAVLDRLGALFGRDPRYLPGAGAPGQLAIGASPDALFGQELMTPKGSTPWHNQVAARSLLSFSWRRPVRRAAAIRCPILLIIAEHDTMAPVDPALRVADKAQRGEVHRSRGGHYDVYQGGESFDDVVAAELEFLRRHAKMAD